MSDKTGNWHLLNTNGVLKVFDMPVEPTDYCTDFGDVILICGNTFCTCDRKLKSHISAIETAKAAAIDVVNAGCVTGTWFIHREAGLCSFSVGDMKPGEDLPLPEGLGVEIGPIGKVARIIQKI